MNISQSQRRSLLMGDWAVESKQERILRELAKSYHLDSDAYDEGVCTGRHPRSGEPIPMTPQEMRLVNKQSRDVRELLICEGERHGFTRIQVEQAIQKYCKD